LRLTSVDVIDQQPVEGVDLDVWQTAKDCAGDLDALLHREERRLLRIDQNRHDNAIEQPGPSRDDVHVPVGQRVERAGIDS